MRGPRLLLVAACIEAAIASGACQPMLRSPARHVYKASQKTSTRLGHWWSPSFSTCPRLPTASSGLLLAAKQKSYPIHSCGQRTVTTLASATMPVATSGLAATEDVSYLTQSEAIAVDEQLMGPALGFSVDQLMELAGLSVAQALAAEYPPERAGGAGGRRRVLVLAGPGNNGGDGLVAARHLHHWGYDVKVCYPKPTDKPLYNGLVKQISTLGIPLVPWGELSASGALSASFDVVVDALFGFSFSGTSRPPFDEIIKALLPAASPPPIVSVDIPSGWSVEAGDSLQPAGQALQPDMLVSLTAPKLAAQHFKGAHHYLGGRFVPPAIREHYKLRLPPYPGTAQCVKIGGARTAAEVAAEAAATAAKKVADMRISYTRGGLEESMFAGREPMEVFGEWFKAAVEGQVCEEPNALSLATCDASGRPSVRVVLLKGFDARGFVFYTNYSSRKGSELSATGHAAFSMYWEKLQRQIRVEGVVEKVPVEESTEYFHSRPRGSQIGAWVSNQSQPVQDRGVLDARYTELMDKYADESVPVPRPEHWGGYLIRPTAIEFWQGRPSRVHDRIVFRRAAPGEGQPWVMERLQP